MHPFPFAASLLLPVSLSLLLCTAALHAAPVEIPHAAQPQLAATADGRVWLAFGRGKEIFVARSDDQGATFAAPVQVAALPSLMLGKRRGPRIAVHGDRVTVTAMAGELYAFHSKDAGKTWAGPVRINDVPRAAREGLNGLAISPDGRLFTTWLDLRGERTQLYSSESADGGATWSANQVVYRAPAGQTVCECCHPSAQFNSRGDLAVMWRNAINGARDMWLAIRPASATEFGPAGKLGEGTWPLKACPMDGGAIYAFMDTFVTCWMRDGEVFSASPSHQKETRLVKGRQPVACSNGMTVATVWESGTTLWSSSSGVDSEPIQLSAMGRFATLTALVGTKRFLVAYERHSSVVVQSVPGYE